MNKRHYEHTLPNIRGSLSNTYYGEKVDSPASVDYAVSLGNVQPGVYFIRIDTAEGTVERKIRI